MCSLARQLPFNKRNHMRIFQGSFGDEEVGYDEWTDRKIGNSGSSVCRALCLWKRIGANGKPTLAPVPRTNRALDGGRAGTAAGFPASGSCSRPPDMQNPSAQPTEAQPGGPSGEGPAKTDQGVARISLIHGDVSTQPRRFCRRLVRRDIESTRRRAVTTVSTRR